MDYRKREEQVEFFRKPATEGGAQLPGRTDAAGEGINLQFCWLMVNYDIPWNPARLEQRMGRIHRYKQKHDPVVIINLVAGKTREGRVLRDAARQARTHPQGTGLGQGLRRDRAALRGRLDQGVHGGRRH